VVNSCSSPYMGIAERITAICGDRVAPASLESRQFPMSPKYLHLHPSQLEAYDDSSRQKCCVFSMDLSIGGNVPLPNINKCQHYVVPSRLSCYECCTSINHISYLRYDYTTEEEPCQGPPTQVRQPEQSHLICPWISVFAAFNGLLNHTCLLIPLAGALMQLGDRDILDAFLLI